MSALAGHLAVIFARLEGLKAAIEANDREQQEWHYDRVLRAVSKLERELGGRP